MSTCNGNVQRLQPLSCLKPETDAIFPLIVLNQPLSHQCCHLKQLWGNAVFKAGTDGANNELFDLMKRENNNSFIPDLVTGDFDSIRPEVKSFMEIKLYHGWLYTKLYLIEYKGLKFMKTKNEEDLRLMDLTNGCLQSLQTQGSQLINTPEQTETDFTKCLKLVIDIMKQKEIQVDFLVAFSSFGGRLDHTLSNINTLFKAQNLVDYPIYLIGDYNLSCLLVPGYHILDVTTGFEKGNCSLIPVGGKCNSITTTGLKYNLNKDQMEFGGLISSCNRIEAGAKEVTVETDSPVLWTMSLKE